MSHPCQAGIVVATRSRGKIHLLNGGTAEPNHATVLQERLRGWDCVLRGLKTGDEGRGKLGIASPTAREAATDLSPVRSDCADIGVNLNPMHRCWALQAMPGNARRLQSRPCILPVLWQVAAWGAQPSG